MKNLIIFVLGVFSALLVGFIGTCSLWVSYCDMDVNCHMKPDKDKE